MEIEFAGDVSGGRSEIVQREIELGGVLAGHLTVGSGSPVVLLHRDDGLARLAVGDAPAGPLPPARRAQPAWARGTAPVEDYSSPRMARFVCEFVNAAGMGR